MKSDAAPIKDPATWIYPPIEPNKTGMLAVSALHSIYYEECGNPMGKPVVFLHGGPGAGIAPRHRQLFDPRVYRIILFDQRGCGKSTPHAELRENTTWDLVADIEKHRVHLGVERWMVFGGSWGSTLALAYSQTHPNSVTELVLRGIFTLRKQEIDWFYQYGASEVFPDIWQSYQDHIPEEERHDYVAAYYKRLTSSQKAEQIAAAKIWSIWEGSTITLLRDETMISHHSTDFFATAFARIECHYFTNKGFFREDGQLIKDVHKIRQIPAVIVQGRYDICCPMRSAYDLHRAWPEADYILVPDAGHAVSEPGISKALIAATDKFGKNTF